MEQDTGSQIPDRKSTIDRMLLKSVQGCSSPPPRFPSSPPLLSSLPLSSPLLSSPLLSSPLSSPVFLFSPLLTSPLLSSPFLSPSQTN